MIALVDYGIGNLRSVEKALETIEAEIQLTSDPHIIAAADQVILPGVGAFGDGMAGLRSRGLVEVIRDVAAQGTPLLGICLGMQLLFEASEERGEHAGLALLPGRVRLFPDMGLKIPHTGWNQIEFERQVPLLEGLAAGDYAYFNHSYFCDPSQEQDIIAYTQYALRYASIVGRGNLLGVQFHPEKSQATGLRILKNFVERCK